MEQFEKVVQGLECCYMDKSPKHCEGCPYNMDNEGCGHDAFALERDALALIRQQQERIAELEAGDKSKPVKTSTNSYGHKFYYCPSCGRWFEFRKPAYCDQCGQKVKWE